MSGTGLTLLQAAVYTRLSGDATLVTTLGAQVYDEPVEGADFPYVVIGDVTEAPNDTMGTTGREVTLTVNSFSRPPNRGMKKVLDLDDRVDELLDRWAPSVSGWAVTQMSREFFETFRDEDGITRRGSARYRVYMRQT